MVVDPWNGLSVYITSFFSDKQYKYIYLTRIPYILNKRDSKINRSKIVHYRVAIGDRASFSSRTTTFIRIHALNGRVCTRERSRAWAEVELFEHFFFTPFYESGCRSTNVWKWIFKREINPFFLDRDSRLTRQKFRGEAFARLAPPLRILRPRIMERIVRWWIARDCGEGF